MCGITGFLDPHGAASQEVLATMVAAIHHRGPDDAGYWIDPTRGLALGHARLAILDLSVEGHQPMQSHSGRFVICFNGEVYNFATLRRELEQAGDRFRGHSDTEVMLAAIERWGLEAALGRFNGMFAFALWDRVERVLHLARDRLGEKPLYYGYQNGVFLFGSELKALRLHPAWGAEIDRDALTLFLRHNYIPGPWSIYRGIHKLPPATFLTLHPDQEPEIRPYWSLREVAERGGGAPVRGGPGALTDRLDATLREVIGESMVADVPLGAFLSGGYDSSTVVALMQALSRERGAGPVRTFSIGFHEEGYDEAHHARAVAAHLGTAHTELYVTPQQALDVIPRLPWLYDEPFADSSQIPTHLVSQLTREHVTVALSGDGGDELFGGYNRYTFTASMWGRLRRIPAPLRRLAAGALTSLPPARWNRLLGLAGPLLPRELRAGNPGDKLHKLAGVLALGSPEALYRALVSHWQEPDRIVLGAREPATLLNGPEGWARLPGFVERMMYLDALTYLPDDILVKVDRAAMGVSLETRVPFLDRRVVELAWSLPLEYKVRGGEGKWLLRQVLYRYVPREMMERPKMGFGVPIDQWLRGPLRDWAEALLDPVRLAHEGFFDPAPIRERWEEHQSGRRNWQYLLWDVLMFQAWLEGQG